MLVNNVKTYDLEYKHENPNDRGVIPKKDLVAQKFAEKEAEIETVDLDAVSSAASSVPKALTLIGDPSRDTERFDLGRMGMERETPISTDGITLEYKKKELLDDGTIKYYDKDGEVFKIIKPDGSVELYGEAIRSLCTNWIGRDDGITRSADLPHLNYKDIDNPDVKLVIDSDGNYRISNNRGLIYSKDSNGNETTYDFDIFSGKTEEHYYAADGAEKIIKRDKDGSQALEYEAKADGSYTKYSNGTVFEEKNADGSYKQYDSDGRVKLHVDENGVEFKYDYRTNSDGSTTYTNVSGSDGSSQYYENGVLLNDRQANGHEYRYDNNGNLYTQTSYERVGDTNVATTYDAAGTQIVQNVYDANNPFVDFPTIN